MCSNRCGCSGNNFNNYSNVSSSGFTNYNGMNSSGFFNNTRMSFGNAYVPNQMLTTVFTPAEGLANGTMFPELVSSYYPNQSLQVMNYLRNSNGGGCCN